jgi:hypothetical protein
MARMRHVWHRQRAFKSGENRILGWRVCDTMRHMRSVHCAATLEKRAVCTQFPAICKHRLLGRSQHTLGQLKLEFVSAVPHNVFACRTVTAALDGRIQLANQELESERC